MAPWLASSLAHLRNPQGGRLGMARLIQRMRSWGFTENRHKAQGHTVCRRQNWGVPSMRALGPHNLVQLQFLRLCLPRTSVWAVHLHECCVCPGLLCLSCEASSPSLHLSAWTSFLRVRCQLLLKALRYLPVIHRLSKTYVTFLTQATGLSWPRPLPSSPSSSLAEVS